MLVMTESKTKRAKTSFKQGAMTEKAFDDLNEKYWIPTGTAYFVSNAPKRTKTGLYIEKGKFDRHGSVKGLAVAVEIKSAIGRWNPRFLLEHELTALTQHARTGGISVILIAEYDRKTRVPTWYLTRIYKDGMLSSRELWEKIDLQSFPYEVENLKKNN